MKLDYIWVGNYRNIQNQQFNIGSEYQYSLEESSSGFALKRRVNNQYICDFFKIQGRGFENVTAVVGENASGKSSLLDFVRRIIKKNSFFTHGKTHIIHEFIAVFSSQIKKHKQTFVLINKERNDIL